MRAALAAIVGSDSIRERLQDLAVMARTSQELLKRHLEDRRDRRRKNAVQRKRVAQNGIRTEG
jgi:hypothetical protein